MTDSGNKYAVSKALYEQTEGAIEIAADKPNLIGRASNGKVWVEHLADMLGIESTPARKGIKTKVAVKRDSGLKHYSVQTVDVLGNNWAVGGAQAVSSSSNSSNYFYNLNEDDSVIEISGGDIFTNTEQQIQDRIALKGKFNSDTLVTYIAGGNNLFYTMFGDENQTPLQTANVAIDNIKYLIDNGARNIIVGNMHDAQEAPVINRNEEFKNFAKKYIDTFNEELERKVNKISESSPKVNLYFIDANKFFQTVRTEVQANGTYFDPGLGIKITNTKEAAWDEQTGKIATNPYNFMYWDNIHPTGNMHKLFAKYVADQIK